MKAEGSLYFRSSKNSHQYILTARGHFLGNQASYILHNIVTDVSNVQTVRLWAHSLCIVTDSHPSGLHVIHLLDCFELYTVYRMSRQDNEPFVEQSLGTEVVSYVYLP